MEIREKASHQVLFWVPISDKSMLSLKNMSYLGYLFITWSHLQQLHDCIIHSMILTPICLTLSEDEKQ